MTEEGTTISRYITEREWFRLQYDRYIGPPPDQSNEPKFKDVFAEIRRKANDRPVKEAKYIKEVPLCDKDVTYLDWKAAPPMVYCSCPQTKCICNSNKLLDDQDIPTGKRYEPNILQKIFSCCCSYSAPEPAGTLIPRLKLAARTEMAVTNAMLESGLTNKKGPEFCMSGCQKFYTHENQQLKAPRSQSESDIHCIAEIRIMRDEFERIREYAEDVVAPSQEQMRKISENCQLHGIKAANFSSSTLSNRESLQKQDPYKPLPEAYAGGENACLCQQRNSIQIAQKNHPQTRLKTDTRETNQMRLPDCGNSSNSCCKKKETVRLRLNKVYCECKRYIRRERITEMKRQRKLEIEHRNDIKRRIKLERENVREKKREMKRQMNLERQKMRELQREMRGQKKLKKKSNEQAPNTEKNETFTPKNEVIKATQVCDGLKVKEIRSSEIKEKQVSVEEICQVSLDKVLELPTTSKKYNCSHSYKYVDLKCKQSVPDNCSNNILHSCDCLLRSLENKPNNRDLVGKESQNIQASHIHTLKDNCDVFKLIPTKTNSFETTEKHVSMEEDCQISLNKVPEILTVSDTYNCCHNYKYADLQSKQSVPNNYNSNIPHLCESSLRSPGNRPNMKYLEGKENQNIQASLLVLKTNKNHNNFSCECNFFKNHYTQCILSDNNLQANNQNATKYINAKNNTHPHNIGAFDIREAVNENIAAKENLVNVSRSQLRGTVTESKQNKTSHKKFECPNAKELISKEVLTFNSEKQNRLQNKVKSDDNVLNVKTLKLVNENERPRDASVQNILNLSQNNATISKEILFNEKTESEVYRDVGCECRILDCSTPKKDGVTQSNDMVFCISRHEADRTKRIRKKSENVKPKKNINKQLNKNKSIKIQKSENKDINCECSYFAKGSVISLQDKLIFNSEHKLELSKIKDDKIKEKCVKNDAENTKKENIKIKNCKKNSTMYCAENSCKHVINEKKYLLENVKSKCPNKKNKLLCQTRTRSLHSGISNECTSFKLLNNDQEILKKIPVQGRLRGVDPDQPKDMKYKSSNKNNMCDDHDNFGNTRSNSSTLDSSPSQDICLCSDSDEPPTGICKNKINADINFSRSNLEILKKEKKNLGPSLCNVTPTKQSKKKSEQNLDKLRTDPPESPKIYDFTPKIKTDREKELDDKILHLRNLPPDVCTCSDEEEFPGSKCNFFTKKTEQGTHNKFDQIFKKKKRAEPLHTSCNKNYRATIETKNDSSKASTGVIWINSKPELRSENLNFSSQIASSGKPIKNEQKYSKCIDSYLYSSTQSTVNPIESKVGISFDTNYSNLKFRDIAIRSAKGIPKVTNINEVCKTNIQQVTHKFIHEVKKERKDNYRQKCKSSISKMHINIKQIPSKAKFCFDSTPQKDISQNPSNGLLNDFKRTADSLLNVESLKSLCSFSGHKSSVNLFKETKIPITNRAKPQAGKDDPKKFTACILQTKKCKKPRRVNSKDTIVLNKLHIQKTVKY